MDIDALRCCIKCWAVKSLPSFHLNSGRRGIRRTCKVCVNEGNRETYYKNKDARRVNQRKYEKKIVALARTDKTWLAKHLVKLARQRARERRLPFNITYRDVPIPDHCPVLGIPLFRSEKAMTSNSATIDRIVPHLGYVVGNVIAISLKANVIKNNATPDEILKVGLFFKKLA